MVWHSYLELFKKNTFGSTSFILMFMYFGVGRPLLIILLQHTAALFLGNLYVVFL